MFGLARGLSNPSNPFSGFLQLARINTSNGSVTTISSASQSSSNVLANQTIDNRKNHYYFVNGAQQLVKTDLATGTTVAVVTLSNTAASYFDLINYHCADSTLYGLSRGIATPTNPQSGNVYFSKVNPVTGSVTNISTSSIANSVLMSRTTIDSKNNIFYFIDGASQLKGIDLASGTMVSSVTITNTAASYFGDIVYNRLDSTIYGIARGISTPSNPQSGYLMLARINPSTGIVTNISAASVGTAYVVGSTEIDPYNNAFFFINGNSQLVTLSLISGSVQSSNTLTFIAGQYLDGMRYKHRVCTSPGGQISYLPKISGAGTTTILRELEKSDEVTIFPNPIQTHLQLRLEPLVYSSVRLMDISGRVILHHSVSCNSVLLDLSGIAAGLYTLQVSGDHKVVSKQVLVAGE